MISFKEYLNEYTLTQVSKDRHSDESGLPKLNKDEIKFMTLYITKLSDWIEATDITTLSFLADNKNKIDKKFRKSGIFYRGINLNKQEMKYMFDDGKIFFEIDSWTVRRNIAKKFAEHAEVGPDKDFGIIIKQTVATKNIVLNIEEFVLDKNIVKKAQSMKREIFSWFSQDTVKAEAEVLIDFSKTTIKLSDNTLEFYYKKKPITYENLLIMVSK